MLVQSVSELLKIVMPVALLAITVMGVNALFRRNYYRFFVTIAIGVIGSLAYTFLPTIQKAATDFSKTDPAATATAAPTPIPTATNAAPATGAPTASSGETVHLPWDILGFSAAALVLIVLVVLGVFVTFSRVKKATNKKTENIRDWKELVGRYESVRSQRASYEMDMGKIIDFPLMSDMREPSTAALHKALKNAASLAPKSQEKFSYAPIQDSAFLAAVNDLEVAFNTAEQTAKKVAWGRFTAEERRSLATAKNLLALALDSGASPSERQAAYKRVFKELQGLIEFPEKARLAIEATHQLSLAA